MSLLSQLLVRLAAYWPIVLIVTGSSILLLSLLVYRKLKKGRRTQGPEAKKTAAGEAAAPAEPEVEMLPPTPMPSPRHVRRTVSRGFRALRERVTNAKLRYRTPCFLILGAERAGKTTVLDQLMPEQVAPADSTEALGCRWHFFDRAVAIEVDGRLLVPGAQASAGEKAWNALHRALRFHRPERPIDGIILTIPASDVFGARRLDDDALVTRARAIFDRLLNAQRILGVRIPVYMLVTKCDLLPGFQDFCTAVPEEKQEETFGWSNPYALESAFVPEWIDEAFDSLSADLLEVQTELLARGAAEAPDEMFQFSSTFRAMHRPLRSFAAELCRQSTYQESFFFRGLYFTGDGTSDPAERLADSAYRDAEPADARGVATLPALPANLAVSRDPYFVRDLFREKIFGEIGLARPVSGSRISRNRTILGLQAAILAIVVIGGLGIWRADVVLERENGLLLSVLDDIEADLRFLDEVSARQGTGSEEWNAMLGDRVFPLLSSMARVNENRLASVFLPSSWASPLHWQISESMRQGFTNVILPSMYGAVLAKADSLVSPPAPEFETAVAIDGGELPRYLSAVVDLGRNIERYDTVTFLGSEDTELQNMADLVLYLFDEELPPEFLGNERYHRIALWESYGQRITPRDRPTFGDDVVARAELLLQDYYDGLIYRLENINLRFESAEQVQRLTAEDLADFRQLRADLAEVERVLDGSEPFWFDDTEEISPSLLVILDSIPATPLTAPSLIAQNFEEMFYRVRREKLQELHYRLDPFRGGERGVTPTEANMALSPQLATLQAALDTLFNQPFIAAGAGPSTGPTLPPGGRIAWDVTSLDRALLEYSQFETFLAERRQVDTPGMARLIQGLAAVQLESRMSAAVRQAMRPEPPAYAFGLRDRERDLRTRIAAFQEPSRRLVQLLGITDQLGMVETYDEIATAFVDQAVEMLREVDALLEEGGAYRPLGGTLANWNGQQPAIVPAFRARDAEELERYLAEQRNRIRFLVDNLAAPVLGGLLADPLAPYLPSAGENVNALVAKWAGLVEELDRYEAQSGSSSVEVLEQFVREEMTAADLPTCVANSGRPAASGSDFFLLARNRLRNQLYTRCQLLAVERAAAEYGETQRFFNANLAGRFPFARGDGGPGPGMEADVASLRQFYTLYDAMGIYRAVVNEPGAARFLEEMGEVRAFLQPLLDPEAQPGSPAFNLAVEFRANRADERGGDQIVDWTLAVGETPVSYRSAEAQTTTWRPGAPAGLTLRWALQSAERPEAEGYVGGSVAERDASFRYEGRWSLLRLLQNHVAAGSENGGGYLLRFEVPTIRLVGEAGAAPSEGAQVFMNVRLDHPQGGTAPALPIFPVQAPDFR
ncbi:MAG: type VI secretion system protein [Gemmatimonadota bacterium]